MSTGHEVKAPIRSTRRWLQFGVRTLLVVSLLVAVVLWLGPVSDSHRLLQRDLAVVVTAGIPEKLEGNYFNLAAVDAALVNRSRVRTYYVVRPGDSSRTFQEPHLFYTAEIDTGGGRWEVLNSRPFGIIAGSFDAMAWSPDVIALEPGERLSLKHWLVWHLEDARLPAGTRRMRIYLHYRYDGPQQGVALAADAQTPVAEIEPFELISEPIEITIRR